MLNANLVVQVRATQQCRGDVATSAPKRLRCCLATIALVIATVELFVSNVVVIVVAPSGSSD